ncbi:nitrate reductase [Ancylobacter radicis]|uniref:Molybdopterin-dependent oxidoreductase n=1 Tax=Ancylobacter radicis TaxID=2836179 RepID=A0ABS5RFC2_9HYPH|nr:nitrate reductase [Ancylobacter radicis]MBS9479037.1 molybdopterin-dependent oxidoreductase [Ancylobacter radicis]
MTALTTPALVRTTCPYCGTGCGVLGGPSPVTAGDPGHPANHGRVCTKGSALGETLSLENRLLHPMVKGERTGWETALDLVAARFRAAIETHGPESVAFYASGQLLTEDYYVANKLMKGFIGAANIDTNSRLCMASSVAGHVRAFGEDIVPCCYEDLDEADLVILVGSNAAWCHPILFRRLTDARARRGTRLVAIDPRRSATASDCDLFLPIHPGTDVLLFNGLLAHLARIGALDKAYLERSTAGFPATLAAAQQDAPDVETVARGCGLEVALVEAFYAAFAATRRVVTVYSQGVNQSSHGTDKVNAIINCHLATGRIGAPGMGPFSFTGQPNAMGGREVGGLANQLAAHAGFTEAADLDRVRDFWRAPRLAERPGLKAVELFNALGEGRIRALWVMGTNPAASLPDAARVRAALESCDFLVVSDCVAGTDTARHADVLLPAAAWGEKAGTVTNSERRISRQRAFMPLPGEARPDWWMLTQVARRLGHGAAFAYDSPADIFREHAALSGFRNERRLFDISGLADLSDADYEALDPVQWPVPAGQRAGTARLLTQGRFPTPDGRARLVPVRQAAPAHAPSTAAPLVLNTGRLRDQWHTMTRTGEVPRLMAQAAEAFVAVHPLDAAAAGLREGDIADITSAWGRARGRVRLSDDLSAGQIFMPMHWTDEAMPFGSPGRAVNPDCDAVSGQPELKHTPVRLSPVPLGWEGLLLSRRRLRPENIDYWARTPIEGGHAYRLAGSGAAEDGMERALHLLGDDAGRAELRDQRRGIFRCAITDDAGRMLDYLMIAAPGALPDPDWLFTMFASTGPLDSQMRRSLLAARSSGPVVAAGEIVCSCFGIGSEAIRQAISDGARDTAALGAALKCGTNCGSCLPELRRFIAAGEGGRERAMPCFLPS